MNAFGLSRFLNKRLMSTFANDVIPLTVKFHRCPLTGESKTIINIEQNITQDKINSVINMLNTSGNNNYIINTVRHKSPIYFPSYNRDIFLL